MSAKIMIAPFITSPMFGRLWLVVLVLVPAAAAAARRKLRLATGSAPTNTASQGAVRPDPLWRVVTITAIWQRSSEPDNNCGDKHEARRR
jgi:hypothetical protein